METKIKRLILIIPLALIIIFCIFSIASGSADIQIKSFAVDSAERMYVGTESRIDVFDQGVHVFSISPQTSRGYMFTITEDDTILLSTGTIVYSMELDGKVIGSWDDKASGVYNNLQKSRSGFISKNNDIYTKKNTFGRTKIVKNDDITVYEITVFSYIVKLLFYGSSAGMLLLIFNLLSINRRKQKGQTDGIKSKEV